jgi:exopolyphosphatase/guanosine-5'-triphosphate,3'-diphosphate pyrophosphatase
LADQPLAVIDVGSNSGRMIVVRAPTGEHLDVLCEARVPLRLARDVAASGSIGDKAIERTLDALHDFRTLAESIGAARTIAVATAAVRTASNAAALLDRIRDEVGIEVSVIDGEREAALAFAGAVHSLPVEDGMLLDVGGGSLELSVFSERKLERSWTLPLGALLVSERFLTADPPERGERRRLIDHVVETLRDAGVERLAAEGEMVATGGTVRNLAKMDRRERNYPVPRLHGYLLPLAHVDELTHLLASRPLAKRTTLSGLNPDRGDSIVGGAIVVRTVMEFIGARELIVSGKGLREGVALDALTDEVPPAAAARASSLHALASRMTTWDPERSTRRSAIAAELLEPLGAGLDGEIVEMLHHACVVLDAGASLDPYNRHEHAAAAVLTGDLSGFSHPQLAAVAAILRRADKEDAGLKPYKMLLRSYDPAALTRAAAVLAVADEIDRRLVPGASVVLSGGKKNVSVAGPLRPGRWLEILSARTRIVFGRSLSIKGKEATS